MFTASQWLDLYKFHACIYSDYQLAKSWHIPATYISQYRRNRLRLPLASVLDIAEAVGVEPLEIIACLEYPRAREKHRERIRRAYFDALLKTIVPRMSAQYRGGFVRLKR
ncbi:hypothetical protein H9Q10_07585 [Eikenella sp. S3360]|uniref:HTH cro/C1-type domain-containing protein n=1 Tax=Eikenella glucosivorans TaxID=2766967 RepID=A0ABS0NB25_9NEIS|nr:hypothetical protein [Eikenella glucosivorans]MBH5329526.1 hypothetical protein [Eikenella glucosivorans]